jgi:hypothetical protein
MTQELLAGILGLRRDDVTEAVEKLHHAGFIGYRRAHITVLKRTGLESCACECYVVVKREMARLLPEVRCRQDIVTATA